MQLQRKEFVDVIQESFQDITGDFLNKRVSAILVDVFAEAITRVLAEGNSVNLRGFGTFEVRERSGRNYINPSTGEMVAKPSAIYPAFIAGSELKRAVKERLNNETKKDIQEDD